MLHTPKQCSLDRHEVKSSYVRQVTFIFIVFLTICVKALNSIKLEDSVSEMYNNKIKHYIFS